ncbi:zinc finger BED domain-containing 1-like [Pelobates cultripes]|uniref:Zinc finger BED domain-containing 1-like n=1 Tax=Pelobates cultripes TaxID=61616 RepID=A0AAD1WMJ1_PELCU|nr:zinc finger BED domain-containing 1-like [Pelobates cultripes]
MDTESCWITTLHMCQSLLNIKWAILSVMENQLVQNLSKQHWNLLQDLVSVLKIVWIATIFLQEEQNTSVSSVIPCVHGILNAFTHFSENSSTIGKAFVNQIRVEMCRHWDMVNEVNLLASPAVVASFFDPRYKELRFLKPEARGEVYSKVISLLSQTCDTQPGLLLDSGVEETFDQCLQRDTCSRVMHDNLYDLLLGKDPTEIMPEARQQLESYIAEPVCKRSTDPLVWWKSNHHRFPELARLAQQYLIIPSTAIQPERAFSAKQGTMEQRRVVLEQNYMDFLLFIHHNMDLLDLPKKQ